jgi:two-component system chemotaxis sensor kinase CheA
MILDPGGLALLIEGGSEDAAPLKLKPQESADSFAQSFLLFTAGSARPKAIPLSLVTRLQEIEASRIEDSGGRQVVQYCGRLMPVVGLEQSADAKSSGKRPAIVFSRGRDHAAILVDRILDIVEEATCLELAAAKPGTVGTAVLQGKATEIVDPAYYLDEIFASWFSVRGAGAAPGQPA